MSPYQPAFPSNFGTNDKYEGMNLRAYLAARVYPSCVWNNPPHEAAKLAVAYADALIAELNKTNP